MAQLVFAPDACCGGGSLDTWRFVGIGVRRLIDTPSSDHR